MNNRTTQALAALALAAAVVTAGAAGTGEYRSHDSHVHGVARLDLVIAGDEAVIELSSPAANLFGFEHPPGDAAERTQVEDAMAVLRDSAALFVFAADADCSADGVDIQSPWADEDAGTGEHHAHDHHDQHDQHDQHRDLVAAYRFRCGTPQAHRGLEVRLLQAFPLIETLQVQYIVGDRQGADTLSSGRTTLHW